MKILHVLYCDEFEAEGFFTEAGELLHAWSNNDAMWRSEYMNPLLSKLGIEVVHTSNRPDLEKQVMDWCGG